MFRYFYESCCHFTSEECFSGAKDFACDRFHKTLNEQTSLQNHDCSVKKGISSRKKWLNTHTLNNYCSLCFILFENDDGKKIL